MKHFVDESGQVFAYDKDQVESGIVPEGLRPMTAKEVKAHQNPPKSAPARVEALYGLLAIDAEKLSEKYTAWSKSPDLSFAEQAFIEKAIYWRREDPVVAEMATALDLSEAGMDSIFFTAVDLRNKEQADA